MQANVQQVRYDIPQNDNIFGNVIAPLAMGYFNSQKEQEALKRQQKEDYDKYQAAYLVALANQGIIPKNLPPWAQVGEINQTINPLTPSEELARWKEGIGNVPDDMRIKEAGQWADNQLKNDGDYLDDLTKASNGDLEASNRNRIRRQNLIDSYLGKQQTETVPKATPWYQKVLEGMSGMPMPNSNSNNPFGIMSAPPPFSMFGPIGSATYKAYSAPFKSNVTNTTNTKEYFKKKNQELKKAISIMQQQPTKKLVKPAFVDQADWDRATDEQKQGVLDKFGL